MILNELYDKRLIDPPKFVVSNCCYLTLAGSHSYGVADTSVKDKIPDRDVAGICIPPKSYVFPHFFGKVIGFSTIPSFEQYQKHHIFDEDIEWDICVYNIVKFFRLAANANPNIIELPFVRRECVLHTTNVGTIIRDNRKLFVSKKAWKTFRAYAFSELKKAKTKIKDKTMVDVLNFEEKYEIPHKTKYSEIDELTLDLELKEEYKTLFKVGIDKTTRFESQKAFQMDRKFLYHIFRLYSEVEQLLLEGDMDLQKDKEVMKAVRRGEMSQAQIESWVYEKDKVLESLYLTSKLPDAPDEEKLTSLLLSCLEEHYGSLKGVIERPNDAVLALNEISAVLDKYRA